MRAEGAAPEVEDPTIGDSNEGMTIADFGEGASPIIECIDRAVATGKASIVATETADTKWLNLIAPTYDGFGEPSGVIGFSWIISPENMPELTKATEAILGMLGASYAG